MPTRQYIGARYVPKFYQNSVDGSSSWESNVVYDPLTYVTLQNSHMYISKKQVPATVGTPASNPEYWLDTGSYNGFIDSLQNQINEIDETLGDHTSGLIKSVDDAWSQIDNINDVALPNIDSQINNVIASMVEVAEGPHVYSGSADCSDNSIHVAGSFTLEANKYYLVEMSCQFEIAANSSNGEHWIEMEVTTNSAPSVFQRGRIYWCGDVLQYVTNADKRIASIHNAFVIKPTADTTYYIAVRDYKSVNATVGAYPCIQALNFD